MTLAREHEEMQGYGQSDNNEELRAIVDSLYSAENIRLKTVLNSRQVVALAMALSFAEEYDVPLITNVAMALMELKVSDKAMGRKDLRAVLTSIMQGMRKDGDDSAEVNRVLGR